ncbi:MAG: DUF971 domain-containing protein [Beijerinckiaceae bacterium]
MDETGLRMDRRDARITHGPQERNVDTVSVAPGGEALLLTFDNGEAARLPAQLLWRECRSSDGIMRRLSGAADRPPTGIHIIALRPTGHYALNIAFSDGHDRGIFPWTFLSELAVLAETPATTFLDASF